MCYGANASKRRLNSFKTGKESPSKHSRMVFTYLFVTGTQDDALTSRESRRACRASALGTRPKVQGARETRRFGERHGEHDGATVSV